MRLLDFEIKCMREIIVRISEGKKSSRNGVVELQKISKLLDEESGSYTALYSEPAMHSIIIEKCANLHIVDVFKKGAVDTVRKKQCKTSLDASSHYTDLERWPSTSIFKLYKNLVWNYICYDKKYRRENGAISIHLSNKLNLSYSYFQYMDQPKVVLDILLRWNNTACNNMPFYIKQVQVVELVKEQLIVYLASANKKWFRLKLRQKGKGGSSKSVVRNRQIYVESKIRYLFNMKGLLKKLPYLISVWHLLATF